MGPWVVSQLCHSSYLLNVAMNRTQNSETFRVKPNRDSKTVEKNTETGEMGTPQIKLIHRSGEETTQHCNRYVLIVRKKAIEKDIAKIR
ncbi:hypothetical protein POVCU2_0003810 [Plasmodium ovale curtisi]|uniref:Uncharacterized protein n=1 Tax=Plasmodium ovale curtisi TaxID=864141 RepID=A0A1A8VKN8_PLAOA|nr:hypothetical protein POVCU2_0003810 [Plasmodium ovale curtisi]SBS80853.1 hypothetical protein POVCU1_003330 [Plasmodium ovale curtisi]